MLVAEPQRGFSAAPVSAEDLEDLTRARIDIETICIARSIEHGGVAWESGVVAAAYALSRTPKPDGADNLAGFDAWRSAHVNFHDALTNNCGSSWLLRLRGQLNLQNQRYLSLALKMGIPRLQADDEHRKLTEAALARDVEAVTALITEHFWVTTRNLLLSPLLAAAAAAMPRMRGRSRAAADQAVG
jgi:DNA-binding GntR family transcriptional regulator